MKNRFVVRRPVQEKPPEKKDGLGIRFKRISVIGILKSGKLSGPKKRKAIDLLLGRNMALTGEELERFNEKLTWKTLKK